MTGIGTAFLLAAGLAVSAQPQDITRTKDGAFMTAADGTVIQLPQCTDSEGVKVRFQLKREHNPMDPSFWMAFSLYTPTSGPVIQFDKKILEMSPEVIRFAAEHECAHHKLGHVREIFSQYIQTSSINMSSEQLHAYESAADCVAARELQRKYGFGADEFGVVFAAFPANEKSQTHPPTRDRFDNALTCIAPSI